MNSLNPNRLNMLFVVLLACITTVYPQDWPQYLGPTRNSESPQKNILRTWPETGPEVPWTVEAGLGNGGPIVQDGRVYFLDRDDAIGDDMRCFDLNTGELLWNFSYDAPGTVRFSGTRSVPAIDGGYEAGAAMIQVEKTTYGTYIVSELFKNVDFGGHTKPPLFHDGYFYAQYSTNNRRDDLVCMSMEGELMWKTGRDPGFNKGSMILSDGLILATDGEKTLYLIEPDPLGFKQLASADVLEIVAVAEPRYGNQNWAPIALADGKLLIRDH